MPGLAGSIAGTMPTTDDYHYWHDAITDDVRAVYKFFHRPRIIGERPALLAIALYNLVHDGGSRPVVEVIGDYPSSSGQYAWDAIELTKRLVASAHAANLPIIYSTVKTRKEADLAVITATQCQVDRRNEYSYHIWTDFTPMPDDLIVRKESASGFFGTPLAAHLMQADVRSLILRGESTSGCVRAKAVDAYFHGFDTSLFEECCFDRSSLSHKVNLFDLHNKYANVMRVDVVIKELEHLVEGRRAT